MTKKYTEIESVSDLKETVEDAIQSITQSSWGYAVTVNLEDSFVNLKININVQNNLNTEKTVVPAIMNSLNITMADLKKYSFNPSQYNQFIEFWGISVEKFPLLSKHHSVYSNAESNEELYKNAESKIHDSINYIKEEFLPALLISNIDYIAAESEIEEVESEIAKLQKVLNKKVEALLNIKTQINLELKERSSEHMTEMIEDLTTVSIDDLTELSCAEDMLYPCCSGILSYKTKSFIKELA